MNRKKTLGIVVLVIACYVSGFVVGAYPVYEIVERYAIPADHDSSEVPDRIEVNGTISEFPDFNTSGQTQVFDRKTHDPMVVEENGTYYMIVGTTRADGQMLFSSGTPSDPESWTLEDAEYLSEKWEFNSIIKVDDHYLLYGNGDVYYAESVATDNWTKVADNTGFSDLGAYYDEETGLIHVYYEYGDSAGYSGSKIGHAVSPNGINNWTVYPPVWNASDGYGVGDFDIVERNDTVYIVGDYDKHHPRYNVSVWASTNPYDNFQQLDPSVVGYGDQSIGFGVGDPSIVRHNNSCLMFVNVYSSSQNKAKVNVFTAERN